MASKFIQKDKLCQVFWQKAPRQNWEKIVDKTPKLGTRFHLGAESDPVLLSGLVDACWV